MLNLAAYRTDVAGMQREINVASATSGLAQSVYNTANARIWGGEAEARFAVTPHLLLAVAPDLCSPLADAFSSAGFTVTTITTCAEVCAACAEPAPACSAIMQSSR